MDKEIKVKTDTEIVYHCGCSESRLEAPEYWIKHCSTHHNFIKCDDLPATCLCGKQEYEV